MGSGRDGNCAEDRLETMFFSSFLNHYKLHFPSITFVHGLEKFTSDYSFKARLGLALCCISDS